jgi:hypothetical protein
LLEESFAKFSDRKAFSMGDLRGLKGVIVNLVVRRVKKMVPAYSRRRCRIPMKFCSHSSSSLNVGAQASIEGCRRLRSRWPSRLSTPGIFCPANSSP